MSADNGEPPDPLLSVLARWMTDYCDVPHILATHVPDAHNPNDCAGCSDQLHRTPWPCIHHICGCQARDILRQRHSETTPPETTPPERAPPQPRRTFEGQGPPHTAEDQP